MKNENGKKGKAPGPLLDRAAAQGTSLNVLKRFDSEVEEVLAVATHVSLYQMAVTTRQWARKNVEGSLFLVKRRGVPRFQLIVLNKLSTDIFADPVDGCFEFELNKPYLMYTKGNEEIIGVWFYEEEDIVPFSTLLGKVCSALPKAEHSTTSHPAAAPSPSAPQVTPQATTSADQVALATWINRLEQSTRVAAAAVMQKEYHGRNTAAVVTCPATCQEHPGCSANLTTLLLRAQQKHQQIQATVPLVSNRLTPDGVHSSVTQQPVNGTLPVPTGLLDNTLSAHFPALDAFNDRATSKLQLLVPTFFSQPPACSSTPGSDTQGYQLQSADMPAESTQTDKPNKLLDLFTRAKEGPAKPAAAEIGPAAQVLETHGTSSWHDAREKLRNILHRLAQNDVFVDLLAQELKEAGLL